MRSELPLGDSFRVLSDDFFADTQEKRQHFTWSWQAAALSLSEVLESTRKTLLNDPSEEWQSGSGDEELAYRLERCIYVFFMARSQCSTFRTSAYTFQETALSRAGSTLPTRARSPQEHSRGFRHGVSIGRHYRTLGAERAIPGSSLSTYAKSWRTVSAWAERRLSSTTQKDGTRQNWREEHRTSQADANTNFDGICSNAIQRPLCSAVFLASAGRTSAESRSRCPGQPNRPSVFCLLACTRLAHRLPTVNSTQNRLEVCSLDIGRFRLHGTHSQLLCIVRIGINIGEEVVRAVGVEPTRALRPCGFSYRLRLSPLAPSRLRASADLRSGLSLHLTPKHWRLGAARLVSTPS